MKKKKLFPVLISLAVAGLFALVAYLGLLRRFDRWLEDALFQRPSLISGDVVVIGIDERALEELGPYSTWTRDNMAMALEALNADPAKKPAVVAIDTLYSGPSTPEADAHLVKAAADLGNVVTAGLGIFGTDYVRKEDGNYQIDSYALLGYEESYEALKNVTTVGHINAMQDTDGVMRHAVLYADLPEGRRVYSMAAEASRLFLARSGRELVLPPTDARGHFYVSFSGGPGDFYDGVSIADLIAGTVPADYYADKIVFIGPYAGGLQDAVYTPVDRSRQMYGVEYQANVVEALLSEDFPREVSDALQAVLLFVLCFVCLLLFLRLGVRPGGAVFAGVTILGILINYLLYRGGFITHPLWLPLSLFLLYAGSVAVHYFRSSAEKRRVQNMFQRYVDPDIVRELLREGTESLGLQGRLCDIAVLFVDIRGFTTMSERMDPETVVSILNEYLGMTSDVIHRHKGTLDKFVGDCTMAFWGAPLPLEDPCYLACQTALDIQAGAREISKRLEETIGESIHCGVGVNFGPAVVGNIGAESRMDFTAIGDTVNTAARLEANAPKEMVYISRSVADALGDRARTTSLGGTVKLKGKAEGFEVLTLDSLEGYQGYWKES
ncbi:MAG: adenylate/guanylate cyclase domain-containing protein [Lachnospiraceae bacterium]|nr:adenylate/guanylate cyclase domain-containing protein [Lachnospiraceae bacterium]